MRRPGCQATPLCVHVWAQEFHARDRMRQITQSALLELEVEYLARYVGQIFLICDKIDELVVVHAAVYLGDPLPFRHRICLHGEKYNRALKP